MSDNAARASRRSAPHGSAFDPTKQYGSRIEPSSCDMNTLRVCMQRQIDETWTAFGAPDDAKRKIEFASYEAGSLVEVAWLYPGEPRAAEPYASAAGLLTTLPNAEHHARSQAT